MAEDARLERVPLVALARRRRREEQADARVAGEAGGVLESVERASARPAGATAVGEQDYEAHASAIT